jgi:predicted nucleic acid-binding protein
MTKPIVAFDSCTILHLLCQTPAWYPHVKAIYEDAMSGRLRIVVAEVSIAECTKLKPIGSIPVEATAPIIEQFFNRSFIIRRGITSRESALAASLIATYGLGTCDALIAATAAYADAHTLYTTDGCAFRRKPGKLLDVSQVVTPGGAIMKVQPPDIATCNALQAAPVATSSGATPALPAERIA